VIPIAHLGIICNKTEEKNRPAIPRFSDMGSGPKKGVSHLGPKHY